MKRMTHVFSRPYFQIMKMTEKGEKVSIGKIVKKNSEEEMNEHGSQCSWFFLFF